MPTLYEEVIVNGKTTRVNWPPKLASEKLRAVKYVRTLAARRRVCAKARELGLDHLIVKLGDGSETLDTREMIPATDKTDAVYRINPIASQIKGELMNGREITDLTREDWIEECSKPQNPSLFAPTAVYASKANRGKRISAVPAGMTEKPTDEKPKRINQRRSEKL